MLKSFLITALRNLRRNRLYAAINILGLALGVACCLVIFVIVRYESSFDDYHSKADRIYRVNLNQQSPRGIRFLANNYTPLAEAIREEVTGLEAVTAVHCLPVYQFLVGDQAFENKFAFFADQSYFQVFDVTWVAGNQDAALSAPNSVIVTDAFADNYLGGSKQALGSTLLLENQLVLTVSGIVEAPPTNTDHPYSILISFTSLPELRPEIFTSWESIGNSATYIVLDQNAIPSQIYPQLDEVLRKNAKPEIVESTAFYLMPLKDNHDRNFDYSSFNYDFPVPVMIILSIIAGLIALIACINFVNLATAQALNRSREVGIRKVMGSSRGHLIAQYMSEAFVVTLLAVMAGILIANIGMVQLNQAYGGDYLKFHFLSNPSTILFIAGITVIISVLAGFYPAFVLSGYQPVLALKSQTSGGKAKGLSVRRGLVIAQFAGAQILILVTIIMIRQVDFFKDRPYPFDPERIVTVPVSGGNEQREFEQLHYELSKVPGVLDHSFTHAGDETVEFYQDVERKRSGIIRHVDTAYLRTFNLELLAGKNFSSDGTRPEVIVNESTVRALNMERPDLAVGNTFTLNGEPVVICGVMKDSYTRPLSNVVDPVHLRYVPEAFSAIAVHVAADKVSETLAGIEQVWKNVYPGQLFKYQFMNDAMHREYGLANTIFSFLGTVSFLGIFIGCLGLYGLVSFMAVQRTKEIGIRKVFGATVTNIVLLFTRESTVLIAIAFLLAAPLATLLGDTLLREFPDRVQPGFGVFLITLFGSLFVALLAVTYRSYRAATRNPGVSLRSDG